MRSRMAWNRGSRSVPSTPCSVAAQPARALEKRIGKSICSSSASRSRKSSSTSCTTSSMRASGRSTLLTTSTTGRRAWRALRSTNRVWGSGPSEASTRRSTPSTMVRPRSTSPPKSAWPGVSMMLILTPPWSTAVFLARMVMPFSRSRSPESMTRSLTSWLSRKAPDCQSMASTSVVFPWSTWATMATLRMSSRVLEGIDGPGYRATRTTRPQPGWVEPVRCRVRSGGVEVRQTPTTAMVTPGERVARSAAHAGGRPRRRSGAGAVGGRDGEGVGRGAAQAGDGAVGGGSGRRAGGAAG